MRLCGFYTEEVRGRSGRTGFRIVTLDGRTAQLATAEGWVVHASGGTASTSRRWKRCARGALDPRPGTDVLVIDEIGKMECLSPAFVRAAQRALSGSVPVLGTVALAGGGFIAEAKRLPGVDVIALSRENRDRLPVDVAARLAGEKRAKADA